MWLRDQEERTRDNKGNIKLRYTQKLTCVLHPDGRGYRKWRSAKKSLNLFSTFLIFLCVQMTL